MLQVQILHVEILNAEVPHVEYTDHKKKIKNDYYTFIVSFPKTI